MKLSAADCLLRGIANLRANWELVAFHWAGTLVCWALLIAGCVPPVAVLGFDLARFDFQNPQEVAGAMEKLARDFAFTPALALALLASLALWFLALVVWSSVQAGTFGVLFASDRQAPPGAPRDRRWFRTVSLRYFLEWGGRYLWRFFGFVHLYVALLTLLLLLVAVLLVFAAAGAAKWGIGAAFGIGCGGALPIFFLLLLLTAWFEVGQADLAHDGSGVGRASRFALQVIGRRLGAVILLFVLWLFAVVGLTVAFLPVSMTLDVALRDQPLAQTAGSIAVAVVQGLPQALLNVALAAAVVALVRSETARRAAGA